MSWLERVHAENPAAWEAMNDAGRVPPAVDIDALVEEHRERRCGHGQCVDAEGHAEACHVVEDE